MEAYFHILMVAVTGLSSEQIDNRFGQTIRPVYLSN